MKDASDNKNEDFQVLDWLTPIDYGLQQSDFIQRHYLGTGEWFLRSASFQQWLHSTNQMLFCPGIPGVGKTILTSIIIEHLQGGFSKDQKVGIAYIYCDFKRQSEQKAEQLLLSLLKQLAKQDPLPEIVKSLYDRHKRQGTRPTLTEISRALRSVCAHYSPVYIVVDAIDECEDETRRLLISETLALQAQCKANILVTSRPIPDIITEFQGYESLEIRASDQDIVNYLKNRMAQQASLTTRDPKLWNEIITRIVHAADGLYVNPCILDKS